MSWKIHDQWIDLERSRHYVVYRNSATGAEHHLIYEMGLHSCPTCGHVRGADAPVDFIAEIDNTLKALSDHHRSMMAHRERHPAVRIGNGPR